uniref:Uncharacterized protein n=1 Tax=Anguilla anguilla TaxID=7936 RepID=A0A0E9UB20_ANGAN
MGACGLSLDRTVDWTGKDFRQQLSNNNTSLQPRQPEVCSQC